MKVIMGVTLLSPTGPPDPALAIPVHRHANWITDPSELRDRCSLGEALVITPFGGLRLQELLADDDRRWRRLVDNDDTAS